MGDPHYRQGCPSHRRIRRLYLELWAIELDTLARCNNDFPRALHHWLRRESLDRVIHKRRICISTIRS